MRDSTEAMVKAFPNDAIERRAKCRMLLPLHLEGLGHEMNNDLVRVCHGEAQVLADNFLCEERYFNAVEKHCQ